ncbi:MAG: SIS domain-containing protein [Clostridia bacterium]|nr:SIS domain-containing protein [Clostridia bacterium]
MYNIESLYEQYPKLEVCRDDIKKAFDALVACYDCDGKVLCCGNGGSAADSDHIVGELMKGFLLLRPVDDERIPLELREKLQGALPAINLTTHCALSSAYLNDVDPSMIYAQQVYGYVRKGDVVIGISTSGNAKNVVNAITVAKAMGATTIALTGAGGGKIGEIADVAIRVPECETYRIQELHLPVYHALCAAVEAHYFEK